MVKLRGLWMLLIALGLQSLAHGSPLAPLSYSRLPNISLLNKGLEPKAEQLTSNVLARIEILSQKDERVFMKTFNLGELNVMPYTPDCLSAPTGRSGANLVLKLPKVCSGVKVKTGICYNLSESPRSGIGHQEQVLYLVSTKTLSENKWKPFVSLSYLRSQVRGTPRAFHLGLQEVKYRSNPQGTKPHSFAGIYSNVEVLETCCGLQPHENLSLVLSFNYLKPLDKKGMLLDTSNSKMFDLMKKQSQGLDLKVDYRVREGLNLLVKSECLLSNGKLREKSDKPVVIEGSLIVSF